MNSFARAVQLFCMDCHKRGVKNYLEEFDRVFGKPDPVPGFYLEILFEKRRVP